MDVVLLGEGIHLEQVKLMMEYAGGYNIINETPFLNKIEISKNKKFKIICCMLGDQEKEAFLEAMVYCHENNLSFLHPAFVLSTCKLPLSYIPKIRTYGFPGSGNVLLQDFILNYLPSSPQSQLEMIFSHVGSHFANLYPRILDEICKSSISSSSVLESSKYFTMSEAYRGSYTLSNDKGKTLFLIDNFPYPAFTWSSLVSDHGFLRSSVFDFYDQNQFTQILIVRHPFDSIFSYIKKHNMLENNNKYDVIEVFSNYYEKYMTKALESKDKIFIIKYENVLYDTINELSKLSKICELNVSEHNIIEWKERKLFTSLPGAPNSYHFQGGGLGNWKNYIDSDCLKIFEKNKILNLTERLGYEVYDLPLKSGDNLNYNKTMSPEVLSSIEKELYPGWGDNSAFEFISTPKKKKIYYMAKEDIKFKKDDFEKNSLLLQLLVDSFYAEEASIV